MIENAQKTELHGTESTSPTFRGVSVRWRARRLSALEIAEGALLADIAVVFQLFIKYLPIGGDFLRLLVPVIFAVLTLRRGLYVGCMSLCVSLFIIGIVLGPGGAPLLLLEAGAGLFLGLTMRLRLRHVPTILLGVLCGGLALWLVVLLSTFLVGGPGSLLHGLRQNYNALLPLFALAFKAVGLGNFWQHTLFPLLDRFVQWGLQNWLFLLYLIACMLCVPVVSAVYLVTNVFLRLLGYQVRPFPGYRLEGFLYWLAAVCFKLLPRRTVARVPLLHNLKCELRRLNMARLRQRRLERQTGKTR